MLHVLLIILAVSKSMISPVADKKNLKIKYKLCSNDRNALLKSNDLFVSIDVCFYLFTDKSLKDSLRSPNGPLVVP